MEELHEAATAYYINAPRDLQQLAWNFYLALDRNGDGRVSLLEYIKFLQQSYGWIRPNFFLELDRDRDGSLDFWEVLTLYYVVKTRGTVRCQVCQSCLVGLYFTCVTCFDSGSKSYDLCPGCYKRKRSNHHHSFFLDNHILLRSKRGLPTGATNVNLALGAQPAYYCPPAPGDNGLMEAFQSLESGLSVAKMNTCSIM